jgi:hypothetical protein
VICPHCKSKNISTIDSRPIKGNGIRRRKKCEDCGHRWTTHELSVAFIEYYEFQLQRLYALEQFQMASSVYKEGSGKAKGTAWTKSETDRLIAMYFAQAPLKEIAEALNRSYMSVNKRLSFLRKHDKLHE